MLKQIDATYEEYVKAGKRVSRIEISPIGMDHLNSELKNRKEQPEWLDFVKVNKEIFGFAITGNGERQPS